MAFLYKHKTNGKIYRLLNLKKTGLNTFLEVNESNVPTVKKRPWSCRSQEQTVLIRGFGKLEFLK